MEAQDVLCRVFRPDPKKRIGLAQLRRHPWLTGSASTDLASRTHQPLSVIAYTSFVKGFLTLNSLD